MNLHPYRRSTYTLESWAIEWRSDNRIDGATRHFIHDQTKSVGTGSRFGVLLFSTRAAARSYRQEEFGYIRERPDLRAEPHGWKFPQIVRVRVTAEIVP